MYISIRSLYWYRKLSPLGNPNTHIHISSKNRFILLSLTVYGLLILKQTMICFNILPSPQKRPISQSVIFDFRFLLNE